MGLLCSIIQSKIFTFVVGSRKKEYRIHGAAFSELSKPLAVLLNGPHKEAQNSRVEWPDVDEQTFVRFTQWAYTKSYAPQEPEIVLGQSNIELSASPNGGKAFGGMMVDTAEQAMYSLESLGLPIIVDQGYCINSSCSQRLQSGVHRQKKSVTCLVCRSPYKTKACSYCGSASTHCNDQSCLLSRGRERSHCSNSVCYSYGSNNSTTCQQQCPLCKKSFQTKSCASCYSAFTDCPDCYGLSTGLSRRGLIHKFLDRDGINYPTTAEAFKPRNNTESCEEFTGVFMCHAKLYVIGDTYDIPQLRQLSLHRLHATLKEFTLYPSRFNDIATLAKYIFNNTQLQDKIQDMIGLYYACIIEDASKQDGLKSLIDEIPEFAFILISRMSERLA